MQSYHSLKFLAAMKSIPGATPSEHLLDEARTNLVESQQRFDGIYAIVKKEREEQQRVKDGLLAKAMEEDIVTVRWLMEEKTTGECPNIMQRCFERAQVDRLIERSTFYKSPEHEKQCLKALEIVMDRLNEGIEVHWSAQTF